MTLSQIQSDIDFLCGSTSGTYSPTNKIRNVNIAYQDVARLIWDSADGWQYDDSNATTLPVAYTTLVHNQKDYSLPTTAQRLHRVEVEDNSGNWHKLTPLDAADVAVALPELYQTPGLPLHYDVKGRSVELYPTPHSAYCTLASGVAFYVDRDVTEFPVTATTTTPGFATAFHRVLSYAASLDFVQDNQTRQFIIAQKQRLEDGLVRFYGKRNIERRAAVRPASRKRWRQYT